jgi:hypothetical protein
MLLSNVLHFAEFAYLLDLVCVEEHKVLLLQLHHPLIHLLVQLNVRVDQHGHFAANLAQVVDHLLHNANIKTLFALTSREKLDDNPELVVGNGL